MSAPRVVVRKVFRRILLTTPVMLGGCCPAPSSGTYTVTSPMPEARDAGPVFSSVDAGALPRDGGSVACTSLCASAAAEVTNCAEVPSDAGPLLRCTYVVSDNFACGRRPEGLASLVGTDGDAFGRALAGMAYLEAASVPAFQRLAAELTVHGAPERLVRSARRAVREETRHARMIGALAKQHGAHPPTPHHGPTHIRALDEVAGENAAEGCVRETYGALLAGWQAFHAQDHAFRAAMEIIALDEARHAQLAWDVAHWAEGRLDARARRRVRAAREAAVAEVLDAAAQPVEHGVAREAGLPSPAHASWLVTSLRQQMWS
ncbi:MAG: ferritin-like domain-containing protein [Myxococcota bacterium]